MMILATLLITLVGLATARPFPDQQISRRDNPALRGSYIGGDGRYHWFTGKEQSYDPNNIPKFVSRLLPPSLTKRHADT